MRLVGEDLLDLDVHFNCFVVRLEELISLFVNFFVCLLDGVHARISLLQTLVDLSVVLFEHCFGIVLTLLVESVLSL